MYKGERYLVHGATITETQKKMTDLKYKLQHGLFVEVAKPPWMNGLKPG